MEKKNTDQSNSAGTRFTRGNSIDKPAYIVNPPKPPVTKKSKPNEQNNDQS